MSKQPIIIGAVFLILLLLSGFYFFNSQSTEPNSDINEEAMMDSEDSMMQEEAMMEGSDHNTSNDLIEIAKSSAPEAAYVYSLDVAEAGYVAQKRFFQKADAVVVGTTEKVMGAGWFNDQTNSGFLIIELDYIDIASDSAGRDQDVVKLFDNTKVTLEANINDLSDLVVNDEPSEFSVTVPAEITINNVTQEIDFTVDGEISNSFLSAQGIATINMSDFNINPPSLAGIYNVDDEIELKFEMEGSNIAPVAMMEEDAMEADDSMMMEEQN